MGHHSRDTCCAGQQGHSCRMVESHAEVHHSLQAQLSRSTWEQVQGNAKAADVFLQREVGRPEEASFVEEVSRAFEQRQVKALGKLREAAEANEAEAQVQASKASQKQYKAWLNAGVAKGMRPLFRSLAKAENVFIIGLFKTLLWRACQASETAMGQIVGGSGIGV